MPESSSPSQRTLILAMTAAIVLVVIASALWATRLRVQPLFEAATEEATLENLYSVEPMTQAQIEAGLQTLEEMRALWAEKGSEKYNLTYRAYAMAVQCDAFITVYVNDGDVYPAKVPSYCQEFGYHIEREDLYTVDHFFQMIEACYKYAPRSHCEVEYYPDYGAPHIYRVITDLYATDSAVRFEVVTIVLEQ